MGLLFILIYLILIGVVLEISSVLMIISGLDKEIARFQTVSMLTATGFTTKESELILRHPVRRNIAVFLILFGVFSLAVLISTISRMLGESLQISQLAMVTAGLVIVLLTIKHKKIMEKLTRKFHRHLKQEFELHELPIEEILYTSEKDLVTAIRVFADSASLNRSTGEVFAADEDIVLLLIQRGTQKIRQQCMNQTIHEGDLLIVYGNKEAIEEKFSVELGKMKSDTHNEQAAAEL